MEIEQINYKLAEKLGYLKAISFIIRSSDLPFPELDNLIEKMNKDIEENYKEL